MKSPHGRESDWPPKSTKYTKRDKVSQGDFGHGWGTEKRWDLKSSIWLGFGVAMAKLETPHVVSYE
jgi:hypothetical protein